MRVLFLLGAFLVLASASSSGEKHHGHHGHGHGHGPHGHKMGKHHKLHYTDNKGIQFSAVPGKALKRAFDEWKKDFDMSYTTPAEESTHFLTFLDNWKMVVDFNDHANETFEMGLNQFADLSPREFRQYVHGGRGSCMKGHVRKMWKETVTGGQDAVQANPASVDWTTKGVVTAVKNQGQCGSCWAFSTTGSLECRTAIKTGKLTSLSEQQLVDCSKAEGNQGCNGGLMDDAFKYIKKEGGLCSESEYPYHARDGTCKAATCGTKYDAITGFTDVTHNSASSLETAAAAGCVSVAIEADQSAFQFYKTGILSGRCGTRLDHGVLVVGYGTEGGKKYWKVKNSWGATWGEKGYVRICKECNKDIGRGECGILEQPSYPTV